MLRVAGAQVEVTQPAAASAMAPLGRQNYQIERVGLFDFQPALTAGAGGIGSARGFGHDALMALLQRLVQEFGGTAGVRGERVRHQGVGGREFRERLKAPRLRLIEQRCCGPDPACGRTGARSPERAAGGRRTPG